MAQIFSRFIIYPLRRYMDIPKPKYPINLHQSVALNRSQPTLQNMRSPFVDGAKRPYSCSSSSSKGRIIIPRYKRWSQNPSKVFTLFCGVSITAYFLLTETVPYTNRPQLVIFSKSREKRGSESWFEEIKTKYKGKIVENIRVQKIVSNIVEAHKGLRKEPAESVVLAHEVEEKETAMRRKARWLMVRLLNKLGKRESQTLHLEGFKWEVIVVDDPIVNAFCMPNGKIVVFTGLLDFFKEDAEIATIIAHEVGHAVARHYAEKFSGLSWMGLLRCYLYQLPRYNLYNCDGDKLSNNLTMRMFSKRMEMEADYIGVLLMAVAGYDPRAAAEVYAKMGNYGCNTKWGEKLPLLQRYFGNHPCGNERSQLLSKAKVMEEALSIYANNKG